MAGKRENLMFVHAFFDYGIDLDGVEPDRKGRVDTV